MISTTITTEAIQFYSSVANSDISAELIEPKWEVVDESSIHVITAQGVYYFSVSDTTFNNQQFDNSEGAITYLNSL